jgi:hypothetical protein
MLRCAFSAELPEKGQFGLRIFGRYDVEPRPSPNVRIAMSNFDGSDAAGSATLTDYLIRMDHVTGWRYWSNQATARSMRSRLCAGFAKWCPS